LITGYLTALLDPALSYDDSSVSYFDIGVSARVPIQHVDRTAAWCSDTLQFTNYLARLDSINDVRLISPIIFAATSAGRDKHYASEIPEGSFHEGSIYFCLGAHDVVTW
jgi:hypothetical protein